MLTKLLEDGAGGGVGGKEGGEVRVPTGTSGPACLTKRRLMSFSENVFCFLCNKRCCTTVGEERRGGGGGGGQ